MDCSQGAQLDSFRYYGRSWARQLDTEIQNTKLHKSNMQKYKNTKTTTSAIHSWTASDIMAGPGRGRCNYPTCALLAALTGALHRDWTPAPNPKLLPARGRMQGFMEACWKKVLYKFAPLFPGRCALRYFAFSKIESLK